MGGVRLHAFVMGRKRRTCVGPLGRTSRQVRPAGPLPRRNGLIAVQWRLRSCLHVVRGLDRVNGRVYCPMGQLVATWSLPMMSRRTNGQCRVVAGMLDWVGMSLVSVQFSVVVRRNLLAILDLP